MINKFKNLIKINSDSKDKFNLSLYFNIFSLIIFIVGIFSFINFYRQQSIKDLIRSGENHNIALSQLLSHALWEDYHSFLVEPKVSLSDKDLQNNPEILNLLEEVQETIDHLDIVKIKIITLKGRTIFSTDISQIGEDKKTYEGFLIAKSGKVLTKLDHRDTFEALYGEKLENISVLNTYIPIVDHEAESSKIEGVLEIYTNVTPLITKIKDAERTIIIGSISILGILYLCLSFFIGIANKLIDNQHQKILDSQKKFKGKTEELEVALTTIQNAQTQLIQQEKMAALGQLVAGIAHEINTPLGVIQASVNNNNQGIKEILLELPQLGKKLDEQQQNLFMNLLETKSQDNKILTSKERRSLKKEITKKLKEQAIEDPRENADLLIDIGVNQNFEPFLPLLKHSEVKSIMQLVYNLTRLDKNNSNMISSVERASKIIFALKTYARPRRQEKKELASITQGIDVVLEIYHNYLKYGIEVNTNYQESLPQILCYPDELIQVWTNLIYNAIQAMDNKGILTINVIKKDDNFIKVDIIDNGKGIPSSIQENIFEAFFTTKSIGEGSGLGLHITKTIIDKHEGTITVDSEVGKTIFSILLPIDVI